MIKHFFFILILIINSAISYAAPSETNELKSKIHLKIKNLKEGKKPDLSTYLQYKELQELEEQLIEQIGFEDFKGYIINEKSSSLNTLEFTLNFLKAIEVFNSYSSAISSTELSSNKKYSKSSAKGLFPICVPRSRTVLNIFYINGMFNSRYDALSSKHTLMNNKDGFIKALDDSDIKKPFKIKYHNLVNPNEPSLIQLAQVAAHKLKDQIGLFWQYIYTLEKSPGWFQESYLESVLKKYGNSLAILPNDSLGNSFFNQVNSTIQNGEAAILVSHSQGNFYANYIYRKLIEYYKDTNIKSYESFLGNFQVASPAEMTAAYNSGSTLRDDDLVIGVLVDLFVGANDINELNHLKSEDFVNHSFTKAYMGNKDIRSKILNGIAEIYDGLITYGYYEDHVSLTHSKSDLDCELWVNDNSYDIGDTLGIEVSPWYLQDNHKLSGTNYYSCSSFNAEYTSKVEIELYKEALSKSKCKGTVRFESPNGQVQHSVTFDSDEDDFKREGIDVSVRFDDKGIILN